MMKNSIDYQMTVVYMVACNNSTALIPGHRKNPDCVYRLRAPADDVTNMSINDVTRRLFERCSGRLG